MQYDARIHDLLKSSQLFDRCDDAFLQRLANQAQILPFQKGHLLFVHEDRAERFYIVAKGWVKLFRETLDGAQAVVDILTCGHVFGEASIFQDDLYPYSAEIVEPSELISLPLSLLRAELENSPHMALGMLSAMAHSRRQQDQELEHRTLQNASQRIGCFLLRLADQEKTGGPITIHLPYDKTLVAARLGMQPETFSRALGKLKQATGIRVAGATVEMESLDQLVEYSCAACSSEFPCKDLKSSAHCR